MVRGTKQQAEGAAWFASRECSRLTSLVITPEAAALGPRKNPSYIRGKDCQLSSCLDTAQWPRGAEKPPSLRVSKRDWTMSWATGSNWDCSGQELALETSKHFSKSLCFSGSLNMSCPAFPRWQGTHTTLLKVSRATTTKAFIQTITSISPTSDLMHTTTTSCPVGGICPAELKARVLTLCSPILSTPHPSGYHWRLSQALLKPE